MQLMIPASLILKYAGKPASGFAGSITITERILNGDMPITDLSFN